MATISIQYCHKLSLNSGCMHSESQWEEAVLRHPLVDIIQ